MWDNASGLDVITIESNSAANAIYINANGYVGVGNSTPAARLDVSGDALINGMTVGHGGGNDEWNTVLGVNAFVSNTEGYSNVAIGYKALYSNQSCWNVAIGNHTLELSLHAIDNVAIGHAALCYSTSGDYNTAVGSASLLSNETGSKNSAFGTEALYYNTSGYSNTGIGYCSLRKSGTFWQNTAVGAYSLDTNTNNYNTAVGYNTGQNNSGYFNTTCLGIDATATASNMVRIGNQYVGTIGGQVGWTTLSDGRFKEDVREEVPGLIFISKLRPVNYRIDREAVNSYVGLDARRENILLKDPDAEFLTGDRYSPVTTGFIAQEVEAAARSCGFDFSGVDAPDNPNDLYGLRYAEFVVPLVKAVQELKSENDEQQEEIEALKARIAELEKK